MAKRDHIAEIAEIKARSRGKHDKYSVAVSHLRVLLDAMEELDRVDLPLAIEVIRGVPALIVATIQSYLRALIAELIDSGDPYRERATKVSDIKLNIGMLVGMEGNLISLGELVAHSLSFNNPDDISTAYQLVSDTALWPQVGSAREPATRQTYLIPVSHDEDRARIYGGLRDLFRVRHIVCHEARSNIEVHFADAYKFCNVALEFVVIVDYLVAELPRGDPPNAHVQP
jgi:hypothetical protein